MVQSTFADWDEDSLSAHAALDAIRQADCQILAEYLDDLWLPLNFLAQENPGFDAKELELLIAFLIDGAPVLAELASMLSSKDTGSMRLVIAAPRGRPRKAGPLGASSNSQSASAALTRIQQSVVKYLCGLSDKLSALNHQSIDFATFLPSREHPRSSEQW